MASAYDRIKTLVQTAADATSDALHQILLGDPTGNHVRHPPAWSHATKMWPRGRQWEGIVFPAILAKVRQNS